MRFIGAIIFSIFTNIVAILAADHFVVGFSFTGDFPELIILSLILTAINVILMPLARLIFGPLIVLTFGLFIIILNAAALYVLDILSGNFTIEGYIPLLIATLIVGFVSALISFGARVRYRR